VKGEVITFQAREISLVLLVFPAPYFFMDDEAWSLADCGDNEQHRRVQGCSFIHGRHLICQKPLVVNFYSQ
jgi:hypothetical protein